MLQVKTESRQLQVSFGRRRFWGTAQERLRTREYVAVVRNGMIHLKPIDAFYTMRPITTNASGNIDNGEEEEVDANAEAKPVTIIKKRETEEQALARLSSYLHLKKKAEEEPWKVMRLVKK